jgi:hypothetical protein
MPRSTALALLALLMLMLAASEASAARCPTTWKLVRTDTFRLHDTLMRSQGVTSDGNGWFFSWQGGLSRTTDDYTPMAIGTLPAQRDDTPSLAPDGTNHVGATHIGDIDYSGGLIYAPVEDGEQGEGPVHLNNPEYQAPHIALYDATTLLYTGMSYPVPVATNGDGVPWVAIDRKRQSIYTAEWQMPHDRLNVFDMQMRFKGVLPLVYPDSLGPGFRLSRIQGAKVLGHTMYASRDDAEGTVFSIDLRTGVVTKLFSLKPPGHNELEGIAVRRTPDGALLHVLLVMNNDLPGQLTEVYVSFQHFAPVHPRSCS